MLLFCSLWWKNQGQVSTPSEKIRSPKQKVEKPFILLNPANKEPGKEVAEKNKGGYRCASIEWNGKADGIATDIKYATKTTSPKRSSTMRQVFTSDQEAAQRIKSQWMAEKNTSSGWKCLIVTGLNLQQRLWDVVRIPTIFISQRIKYTTEDWQWDLHPKWMPMVKKLNAGHTLTLVWSPEQTIRRYPLKSPKSKLICNKRSSRAFPESEQNGDIFSQHVSPFQNFGMAV